MAHIRHDPLIINPMGLVFFVDETGHEFFADTQYPVFGLGGCAMVAGAMDAEIRSPWRAMKARHFGGADVPLHAADIRGATTEQLTAISKFFKSGRFVRFAAVMHRKTQLPAGVDPYQILAPSLLQQYEKIAKRLVPAPVEVAFIHEASKRGDKLLERYFGKVTVRVEGVEVASFQGLIEKSARDEALEVADFVINAAGGQAKHWSANRPGFRKDFKAVFHATPLLTEFICIDTATIAPS